MSRILFTLAALSTLLMGTALVLGLYIGGINQPYRAFLDLDARWKAAGQTLLQDAPELQELRAQKESRRQELLALRPRVTLHTAVGTLASIVTVLIHCVCVTYFIGTAKWCGEVVGAYELSESLYQESRQLKRRCFRWSLLGIGTMLAIVVLGASSDPATLRPNTWKWVTPHLWAAAVGLPVTLLAFWKQWEYLAANLRIVESVQAEVRQVRTAHGLD